MKIAPETAAVLAATPHNIPPTGLREKDFPTFLDYILAIVDRRERQLSEANYALLRWQEEYESLDAKYHTLLDRARKAHQKHNKGGMWKSFLQSLRK